MKKISLFLSVALMALMATTSLADYQDIAEEVGTIVKVWVGGSLRETDNSNIESLADRNVPILPEAEGRVGTTKAGEFYHADNSASGGFFYKTAHLPQRIHLELDYFNDNEWYGDFRYSYLDYAQVRLLPRRFFHNLDNLTVYDFTGAVDEAAEIEINDQGREDYGLRLDIDHYLLRFKTPNYPLHLYGEGETVTRTGTQQARFLGGSAYFSDLARVTEAREIDQENQALAIGANTHLGPIELDLSRKTRKFESDVANPTYDYSGFGSAAHNVIPKLEATINTLKIHTSHSGRIFASATLAEMDKENDYSGAEARNTMGQGEIFWLPTTYLAFSTKYRHQKNTASAPATVAATNWLGGSTVYIVIPGVESATDTATLSMRYSLIPKTSLNLKYTKNIKSVEDQSALDWSNPRKTTTDEYEFAFTNWVIPKVRTTARVVHTEISSELTATSVNNDPDQTDQFKLAVTWALSPRVVAFGSAYVAKEETENNRMSGDITGANKAEALRQQHLLSLSFLVNDKLTISPSYAYFSDEQGRDIVWDGTVDSNYTNEQVAHSYSLNMLLLPTDKTNINCSVDYTTTDGSYDPTSPFTGMFGPLNTAEIAQFSGSSTEEVNVRFDIDHDLGAGWGLGLGLRYTDWQDDSFDNPSDGEFMGGLLKISKVL